MTADDGAMPGVSTASTAEGGVHPDIVHVDKSVTLPPQLRTSTALEIAEKKRFWRDRFAAKRIRNIVAPMVDQSELAFRMMLRAHGADLTYTPMIHAQLFVSDTTYRKNILSLYAEDRPVIVQFCANNAEIFRDACRLVEGFADGVDINLGCPQNVAKRGHYGSFLQDEVDLICSMISAVRDHCSLPISAKIRIREDREQTKAYARRLVDAGATLLTVHGRTREMKGVDTGLADWSRIRDVVECIDGEVPVIANGNIQMSGDIERCITATGVAAVMSAEGILYNPYLFQGTHPVSWQAAIEYLHYAEKFAADVSAMRAHIFRICQYSLLEYEDLRQTISTVHNVGEFRKAVQELSVRVEAIRSTPEAQEAEARALEIFGEVASGSRPLDASVVASTPHWLCKPYIRLADVEKEKRESGEESSAKEKRKEELRARAAEAGLSIKQIRKKDRRALQASKTIYKEKEAAKKQKYPACTRCGNPAGQGCTNTQCKKCCRWTAKSACTQCKAHRYNFAHLKEGEDDKDGGQEMESVDDKGEKN